jgi:hypothetical protein
MTQMGADGEEIGNHGINGIHGKSGKNGLFSQPSG